MRIKEMFANRYFGAVLCGFMLLMAGNLLWCSMTTFRGMSFISTYTFALTVAMVAALPSLWGRHGWLQGFVWGVLAMLIEANLMYCRTYMTWIPLESYGLAANLGDFTASIADSIRKGDVALPATMVAGLAWLRRLKVVTPAQRRGYAAVFGVIVVADCGLAMAYGGMRGHIKSLVQECYYATTPPVVYTPLAPPLVEIFDTEQPLSPEEKAGVDAWLAEQARRDGAYPRQMRDHRRNLVFVFCESMESWLLEQNTDTGREIMPYLNSLLRDSTTLYLPHVRSQVGTGRSIDAQLLMLTGMAPMSRQVWSMTYPRHTYHSLIHAMKNAEPATRASLLTADKPITWNQALVAEAFGVDTILSRDNWEETELVGNPAKLSDGALMTQIATRMRDGEIWPEGTPAYIQVVTYSGHNPFVLPENLKRLDVSEAYPAKMADYMVMNNYVDHSLSIFLEYLKTRRDWPETMVVIVGDHEALGTYREEWLANPTAAAILASATEVPMIVVNSPVGGRIDQEIGQIDVYSTILDLMGLRDATSWPGMGQSALYPDKVATSAPDTHTAAVPAVSETIIRHDLLATPR